MEKAVDEYMGYLWRLELHPQPPSPVSHIKFDLTFDVAKDDPKQLIIGEDLKGVIAPAIVGLANERRRQRGEAEDEAIQVDFSIDKLVTECENLEEVISNIEVRTNVLTEQADALRKVCEYRKCFPVTYALYRLHKMMLWLVILRLLDWRENWPRHERPLNPVV
jgi:kinetochore protein NDC80